jgi:hypothetical protein
VDVSNSDTVFRDETGRATLSSAYEAIEHARICRQDRARVNLLHQTCEAGKYACPKRVGTLTRPARFEFVVEFAEPAQRRARIDLDHLDAVRMKLPGGRSREP